MVAITELLAPSMTVTLSLAVICRIDFVRSGSTATAHGIFPMSTELSGIGFFVNHRQSSSCPMLGM